jgi:uncharacterized membrane protein YgdD (TMEM256/DUF423 family)
MQIITVMNYKWSLLSGLLLAMFGVMIGAFGAHALREMLIETGRQSVFETAVRYQMYHAFALIICGMLSKQFTTLRLSLASTCFVIGALLFCGSLYVLCLTGVSGFGAVTPVGGLFFLAGWVLAIIQVYSKLSA